MPNARWHFRKRKTARWLRRRGLELGISTARRMQVEVASGIDVKGFRGLGLRVGGFRDMYPELKPINVRISCSLESWLRCRPLV